MTKNSHQLENEIIADALKHGIEISYDAHEAIIKRLEDVQLENSIAKDDKGRALDERYKGWLHQREITPAFGKPTHIPSDFVHVLEERIGKGEHHVKQVVDVVLEEAFPALKAAKAQEAEEEVQKQADLLRWQREEQYREVEQSEYEAHKPKPKKDERSAEEKELDQMKHDEARDQLERESKKDAKALDAHAKKHGITLTRTEVARVFDKLSPLEATRFQVTLASMDIKGVATGRHGNRTTLPEDGISLTAKQYESLKTACPTQMEKAANVIAGLHAEPQKQQGPKTHLQHAQSGFSQHGGIGA